MLIDGASGNGRWEFREALRQNGNPILNESGFLLEALKLMMLTLEIEFKDSSAYEYYEVPQYVFEEFLQAPSNFLIISSWHIAAVASQLSQEEFNSVYKRCRQEDSKAESQCVVDALTKKESFFVRAISLKGGEVKLVENDVIEFRPYHYTKFPKGQKKQIFDYVGKEVTEVPKTFLLYEYKQASKTIMYVLVDPAYEDEFKSYFGTDKQVPLAPLIGVWTMFVPSNLLGGYKKWKKWVYDWAILHLYSKNYLQKD